MADDWAQMVHQDMTNAVTAEHIIDDEKLKIK
jgi:hypothetical protein